MSNPPANSVRANASASVLVSSGISRIDGAIMASPPWLAINFAISAPRRLSRESTRRPAKFFFVSLFPMGKIMPQVAASLQSLVRSAPTRTQAKALTQRAQRKAEGILLRIFSVLSVLSLSSAYQENSLWDAANMSVEVIDDCSLFQRAR